LHTFIFGVPFGNNMQCSRQFLSLGLCNTVVYVKYLTKDLGFVVVISKLIREKLFLVWLTGVTLRSVSHAGSEHLQYLSYFMIKTLLLYVLMIRFRFLTEKQPHCAVHPPGRIRIFQQNRIRLITASFTAEGKGCLH